MVPRRITEGNEHGAEISSESFRLFDDSGAVVADVEDVHFKRTPRESLLGRRRETLDDWLYEVAGIRRRGGIRRLEATIESGGALG